MPGATGGAFRVQMRDSHQMVVRQFRQMSHLLEDTAVELGGELMPDTRGIAAVQAGAAAATA